MTAAQVLLGVLTLGTCVYTVAAYPNKYGALTGRSRLFRTLGVCLLDLLLMLVLMLTFIDFKAGVTPRVGLLRGVFYVSSCLFLCFALVCVACLDGLESYTAARRERRAAVERILREQIEAASAAKKDSGVS